MWSYYGVRVIMHSRWLAWFMSVLKTLTHRLPVFVCSRDKVNAVLKIIVTVALMITWRLPVTDTCAARFFSGAYASCPPCAATKALEADEACLGRQLTLMRSIL